MSAAYTHIAMVTKASNNDLMEKEGIDQRAIKAISKNFKFCELGSISPDYSYLLFWARLAFCGNEKLWSDKMHYEKTGEFIHLGIEKIQSMPDNIEKDKCIAWLLGYASHMTTDTVIHPIVEKMVGEYESNKKEHRICEMNQDVYVFNKFNLGKITKCEYFDSGIKTCGTQTKIDADIYRFWNSILNMNYKDYYEKNTPDINQWHYGFNNCIDLFADNGGIPVLSRHSLEEPWTEKAQELLFKALAYSYPAKYDKKYIDNLETPCGSTNFLDIFKKSQNQVLKIWRYISDGIYNNDSRYKTEIINWDMGTGRNQKNNKFQFWDGDFK